MKRRAMIQLHLRLIGGLLAGAILATGCAGLPPAQPTTDIKAISGKWKGTEQTVRGGFGHLTFVSTLTITENGRYEAVTPAVSPTPFVGTVTIIDGKYRWKSETTTGTGTFTLHEGDGKRALLRQYDHGASSGEYWADK